MDRKLTISDRCVGCGLCVKVCIRGHLVVGEDIQFFTISLTYLI